MELSTPIVLAWPNYPPPLLSYATSWYLERGFFGRHIEFQGRSALAAKFGTMFLAIWIVSLALADAWICGNDGQCACTASGEVLCESLDSAPTFAPTKRQGRRITITARKGHDFDIASLAETEGFDRVFVLGLNTEQCRDCMNLFDFVVCKADEPSIVAVTGNVLTSSPDPASKEVSKVSGGGEGGSRLMTAWVAIASIVGIIVVSCILVSLVNLHVRINTHSRSQDPPVFAVDCCLKCMAVCMYPCHKCARLCSCTTCCLHDLRTGNPPPSAPFSV